MQDTEDQLIVGETHVQGVEVLHHEASDSDVLAEAVDMIDDPLQHVLKDSEVVHEALYEADYRPEVVGRIAVALVHAGAGSEIEDDAAEVSAAFVYAVAGQLPADIVEDEIVHVPAPGRLLLE